MAGVGKLGRERREKWLRPAATPRQPRYYRQAFSKAGIVALEKFRV